MCGIAGLIGKSKNPIASKAIITGVLSVLFARGTDATGISAWNDEKVLFNKKNIKSSEFVTTEWFKNKFISDASFDPSLIITHARASSAGMGSAYTNKNNHPFLNESGDLSIVHNGRIHDYEKLKDFFELKSNCDSEIVLRLFEYARNKGDERFLPFKEKYKDLPNIEKTVAGAFEIWNRVEKGAFSIAVGERIDANNNRLTVFHNEERPLYIFDLYETLGQYFFCSTPNLFADGHTIAEEELKRKHGIVLPKSKSKFYEVKTGSFWSFNATKDGGIKINVFDSVVSSGSLEAFKTGVKIPIFKAENPITIDTPLDMKTEDHPVANNCSYQNNGANYSGVNNASNANKSLTNNSSSSSNAGHDNDQDYEIDTKSSVSLSQATGEEREKKTMEAIERIEKYTKELRDTISKGVGKCKNPDEVLIGLEGVSKDLEVIKLFIEN